MLDSLDGLIHAPQLLHGDPLRSLHHNCAILTKSLFTTKWQLELNHSQVRPILMQDRKNLVRVMVSILNILQRPVMLLVSVTEVRVNETRDQKGNGNAVVCQMEFA